jgi:glycosyltransferase involved in cell wall biosynthesis/peptidoglycan/xylan/chitin deacetylase (PgdA/CDA1 family)
MVELSVIIPTYNRAGRLQACLQALTHQTQTPGDFEVIVVVDGSTDETAEMLAELTTPYALNVLFQANQGQNVARNHGVSHARGWYCLFLDDDIIAEPQLISEHLYLHIHQERVVGIGQISLNINNADWFTQRFAEGWHEHYRQLNMALRKPTWADCYGGNMSVSRTLFLEVGGFAVDIPRSHDIELGYRLEQHGLSFEYLPQAIGHQLEQKRTRQLFADAEKAGAAWITLSERHPALLHHLLGSFCDASAREIILRELLWHSRISPRILAWVGNWIPKKSWAAKWYRFLFTYSYWRGIRRIIPDHDTRQRMIGATPILMYHAIAKPGEHVSRFVISAKQFARQMAWLKRLNYHVLTFEEYLRYRHQQLLPPVRSVIITIDDGYAEIGALIVPILHHYGFSATIFLVSDKIGKVNDWTENNALKGRKLLSWKEIKEIAGENIQFGSHTRTHVTLTEIDAEQAQEEIAGSKADLEHELQTPITTFAYPYGELNATVQDLVGQAGYLGGCGVKAGLNSPKTPLTALNRIEIEGGFSLPRFLFLLRFGGPL